MPAMGGVTRGFRGGAVTRGVTGSCHRQRYRVPADMGMDMDMDMDMETEWRRGAAKASGGERRTRGRLWVRTAVSEGGCGTAVGEGGCG